MYYVVSKWFYASISEPHQAEDSDLDSYKSTLSHVLVLGDIGPQNIPP